MHYTTAVRSEKRSGIDLLGLKDRHGSSMVSSDIKIAVVSNLVILANLEMETGAGHDVHVVKETHANWSEPSDDPSKAGRHAQDGVWLLFHSIGHGILANTETDRPQSLGCAGKYKNKSCIVPKPEVHASNQNSEDDDDT